jgi:thioredoxin reductase (NADPH)
MSQPPSPDDDPTAWPTLDAAALETLATYGETRRLEPGEHIVEPGDHDFPFVVIVTGAVETFRPDGDAQTSSGAGEFLGELSLLTGQRASVGARAAGPATVIVIQRVDFRRMMSREPDVSDVIFRAFMARRQLARAGAYGTTFGVRIIGSRYSPEALALRSFADRSLLAYVFMDMDDEAGVDALLASIGLQPADTPVVITPLATLIRPTPGELAEHLGLAYSPAPNRIFDLVVVGAGPAGLAAAVYGASEGLSTVGLDAVSTGGQAGTSSRIENYVGFPNGISGRDLTGKAAIQAQRLGAQLATPCTVAGLRADDGFFVVTLADGSEIPCRAVIIATGARYRRLAVEDLERFEGAGVYYAATEVEALQCQDSHVVVVGGGNSAGQAAIYLAQRGCDVSLAVRRGDLLATMSRYLIDRIEAHPRIELRSFTSVCGLDGADHLERVTLQHAVSGTKQTLDANGLFCFIGAEAATGWLSDCVALDPDGFVLTDRELTDAAVASPRYAGRTPLPYETSQPGIFAVGDVRSGSMKRVAAAVGEGSSAVRSVHDYLATLG